MTLPAIGEVATCLFHAELKGFSHAICSVQGIAYARPDSPQLAHVAWLPEDVEEPIRVIDPWRRESYGTAMEDAIADALWREARSPKVKADLSAKFDDWAKENAFRAYGDYADSIRHEAAE